MNHFICIYYRADEVCGARFDIDELPGKDSPSLRDDLIEAVGATLTKEPIPDSESFDEALRSVFVTLLKRTSGPVFLTIVGHGPFEFESRRLQVSTTARGAAAGADLAAIFSDLIDDDQMISITDAVAVACAGYWASYDRSEATRSYTIASLIAGTGVGGAVVQKYGRSIGRAHHSEFGHTRVHVVSEDPAPICVCDHHDCCLQGMTCWAAIEARAEKLDDDDFSSIVRNPNHKMWIGQAKYLAQGCQTFMFATPPFQIVLCGSMFESNRRLVDLVRQAIRKETGEEFLYPAAMRREFVVYRPLMREALVGGLHAGISASQKAPVVGLHRKVE